MKEQIKKTAVLILATTSIAASTQAAIIADGGFDIDNDIAFPVEATPLTPTVGVWLWDNNETAPLTAVNVTYADGRFAVGRAKDYGAIYQTTSETITLDQTYNLTANVFNTYNRDRTNAEVVGRLYYMDGTTRTFITGAEASYSGSAQTEYAVPSTMTFDYVGAGAAVGKALGVEFSWEGPTTNNGSWIGVDNVSITTVPEPSSAALLGLGGLALILRRRK